MHVELSSFAVHPGQEDDGACVPLTFALQDQTTAQ